MPSKSNELEQVRYVVAYDGPALKGGEMDARLLGSAMLGLSKYVDAGASLTLGATVEVQTKVDSNFRTGSFSYLVHAYGPLLATESLRMLHAVDVKTFFQILGLTGGGGVIGLVKFLRGGKPKEVAAGANNSVQVTNQYGETTIVHAQVVNLVQNRNVRASLNDVVAPLRSNGINAFRAGTQEEIATLVTDEDVALFEPQPIVDEILQDRTTTEIVRVVSLNLEGGLKWRFRMVDGGTFNSAIDGNFSQRVLRHEVTFGAGDALEVELHSVVTRDSSSEIHATREIVKVIRHIDSRSPQITLELDSPYADGERD